MDKNKGDEMNREEGAQTECPSLSPSNRRKSWRRSTRSRRSLPAIPNPFQILCRSISPSQSPQERLEQLMEASMKLAIDRTQDSLQSTPNSSMEPFQKQVEAVQKEWCSLAKDIHSEVWCPQPPTNIDSDPEMQRAMEQTQTALHRLQAESESWEALLIKHRNKAEELARRVEQGCGGQLDPTCVVQSSQSHLIQGKPDYNSLLCRQLPGLQTMAIVMDTQCKMIRELLSIQEHSQLLVKETSARLAADAGFQDLPSDPVRNILAGPFIHHDNANVVLLAAGKREQVLF
ncbi:kinetochore-associated protein DSN1 homolog [Aplochiton taeniatus]